MIEFNKKLIFRKFFLDNTYLFIIALASPLQKRGIEYTIIEKGTLVNSLFNYPKNMRFFSSSKKEFFSK